MTASNANQSAGEFTVSTEKFEGPLDTLLSLIQQRELYINDISLAEIADDYIAYIETNEESLDDMARFVRIAATLVLAKSKSLLPDDTDPQEEAAIDELEDRLKAYRLVKQRGQDLQSQFNANTSFPVKASSRKQETVFAPGNTLTAKKLVAAIASCVVDLPTSSLTETTIEDTRSLKEEISRLKRECQQLSEPTTFSELTPSNKKHHQVVSFVAILELVKGGQLTVKQTENFSDITIQPKS